MSRIEKLPTEIEKLVKKYEEDGNLTLLLKKADQIVKEARRGTPKKKKRERR